MRLHYLPCRKNASVCTLRYCYRCSPYRWGICLFTAPHRNRARRLGGSQDMHGCGGGINSRTYRTYNISFAKNIPMDGNGKHIAQKTKHETGDDQSFKALPVSVRTLLQRTRGIPACMAQKHDSTGSIMRDWGTLYRRESPRCGRHTSSPHTHLSCQNKKTDYGRHTSSPHVRLWYTHP